MRLAVLSVCLLLAGCLDGDALGLSEPTPASGPQDASAEEPALPGVKLEGRAVFEDGAYRISGTVRNESPNDYWIWRGCGAPWTGVRLLDPDGERIRWERPVATCAGHSHSEFPAGESIRFKAEWNQTVWDEDERGFVDAGPGTYTFRLNAGPVAEDEEMDQKYRLTVDLELEVPA